MGFQGQSSMDYVQAFRDAIHTLEEYQQALPDPFLASTFVDHIRGERFDKVKQQLLKDVSTHELSLESCIHELLMADHMMASRSTRGDIKTPTSSRSTRKRPVEDVNDEAEEDEDDDRMKRLKADPVESQSPPT